MSAREPPRVRLEPGNGRLVGVRVELSGGPLTGWVKPWDRGSLDRLLARVPAGERVEAERELRRRLAARELGIDLDWFALAQEELESELAGEGSRAGVASPSGPSGALAITEGTKGSPGPVEWLWPPWLPRACYVDLAGDPGAGKTFLALELVACATRGRWPGGAVSDPTNVLILAAEDAYETVLLPRLVAAGADRSRFAVVQGLVTGDGVTDLALERDYLELLAEVNRRRAGLVYIDALVDVLPVHDGKTYTESRAATRLVARLARESRACLVATRHMGKAATALAWQRSIGSVAYASRARVMLQVYQDQDDPERRVLTCCKHNFAPLPPSLAFRLEGATGDLPPHVGWIGIDPRGADELARAAAGTPREAPATARATTWLRERLAGGPVETAALVAEAKALGMSRPTLYRAAEELGVEKEAEAVGAGAGPSQLAGRRSRWALPSSGPGEGRSSKSHDDGALGETSRTFNGLADLALDVSTRKGVETSSTAVLAAGALVRLRTDGAWVVAENLDGSLEFARVPRTALVDPATRDELGRAPGIRDYPARRDDLERLFAELDDRARGHGRSPTQDGSRRGAGRGARQGRRGEGGPGARRGARGAQGGKTVAQRVNAGLRRSPRRRPRGAVGEEAGPLGEPDRGDAWEPPVESEP